MSGDLSALVARLEAVTARLESAADKASGGAPEGMIESLRTEEVLDQYISHSDISLTLTCVLIFLSIYIVGIADVGVLVAAYDEV